MTEYLAKEKRELLEKISLLSVEELNALDDEKKKEYLDFVSEQCSIVLKDDDDDDSEDNNIVFEEINITSKLILDVWDSIEEKNTLDEENAPKKKMGKKKGLKVIIPIIAVIVPVIVGVIKFFSQKKTKK